MYINCIKCLHYSGVKRSHATSVEDDDDEDIEPPARRSPPTSPRPTPATSSSSSQAPLASEAHQSSPCPSSPQPNDGDDNSISSDDSHLSRLSNGGSEGEDDTPEPAHWVQQQMRRGHNPRAVLSKVCLTTYLYCTSLIPPTLSSKRLYHIF